MIDGLNVTVLYLVSTGGNTTNSPFSLFFLSLYREGRDRYIVWKMLFSNMFSMALLECGGGLLSVYFS